MSEWLLKVGDRVVERFGEPDAPNGDHALPPCGALPEGSRGTIVQVLTEEEDGSGVADKFVRIDFDNHGTFTCDKDMITLLCSLNEDELARFDAAYAKTMEEEH